MKTPIRIITTALIVGGAFIAIFLLGYIARAHEWPSMNRVSLTLSDGEGGFMPLRYYILDSTITNGTISLAISNDAFILDGIYVRECVLDMTANKAVVTICYAPSMDTDTFEGPAYIDTDIDDSSVYIFDGSLVRVSGFTEVTDPSPDTDSTSSPMLHLNISGEFIGSSGMNTLCWKFLSLIERL